MSFENTKIFLNLPVKKSANQGRERQALASEKMGVSRPKALL